MKNFYHPTRKAYLEDMPRHGRNGPLWTKDANRALAFTEDCREELIAECPELAQCEVRDQA